MRDSMSCQTKGGANIGRKRIVPFVFGNIFKSQALNLKGCVIDENINAAKCRNGIIDNGSADFTRFEIAGEKEGPATGFLDPACCLFCVLLFLGEVGEGDVCAFAGIADSNGTADA